MIEDLGDDCKLRELLASVNNVGVFSSLTGRIISSVLVLLFLSSYFFINNSSYRSYFVLVVQIVAMVCIGVLLYLVTRYVRAIFIRSKTLKKFSKYAEYNKLKFSQNACSYLSIFIKGSLPEWTIETDKERYIFYLWSTVKSKKTLRLLSNGMYSYYDNIGYTNLVTNPRGHILTAGAVFCPPNINYYEKFRNTHTEMVELKKGFHLIPKINWESCESNDKTNIRIFLLNPVPFNVVCVENGVEKKIQDGYKFGDFFIWSAEGFLSFLKGEEILRKF